MNIFARLFSAAVLLALACSANAQTYMYSGAPVAIPDNDPVGVTLDINVSDTFRLSQFHSVSLTFAPGHTFAGDLVATLTHLPSGKTIDLMRRLGKNSQSSGGDNSNLNGTYTFSNLLPVTGAARLIDAGVSLPDSATIPNGVYRPTTNTFMGSGNPTFSGDIITNLNVAFDGLSDISGIWRLSLSDHLRFDTGTISGFAFTVNAVPEPGSFALLVGGVSAGGILLLRRRRK